MTYAPEQPPLNYRAVVAVAVCNSAHFYSICSIFSYAGFLAVDCGWAADEDTAGWVAGLLPTFLILGRLPTATAWGVVADRFGRKPSIMISMASVALGNLLFGITTNLWLALAVRFVLLGALNGFVTLMGMCCLEIGGAHRQVPCRCPVLLRCHRARGRRIERGTAPHAQLGNAHRDGEEHRNGCEHLPQDAIYPRRAPPPRSCFPGPAGEGGMGR